MFRMNTLAVLAIGAAAALTSRAAGAQITAGMGTERRLQ
jgi:hypothetical protein